MNFDRARFNLIEQQIRPWMVLDQSVLDLLNQVPREHFVDDSQRSLAFSDTGLPILMNGKATDQYMLSPKLEARLLQELAPLRHESILEVGTGSGYMAALLAHKSRDVLSLECHPELAQLASERLKASGISNAKVLLTRGDFPQNAGPFDAILVSGHMPEIPPQLLSLLKEGGRLLAITGHTPVLNAVKFSQSAGQLRQQILFECEAPSLKFSQAKTSFKF
jgi:protein-L-isoaspartate(D-aspartate) O-methyltransferase